mmetsp:Transcript_5748/g.9968  ORF Transcript_5748/g.9968 Transcript_5748/m.9968 type:complete len:148 (-) Transcript_5748:231-674(-)|eukprot:TRINITY_DN115788_c0_g1_i1.p2 TRINITY_DN115788_c0_g1~~TRINITY_DN115788_c0_g1_i1.p2  ORF type:complete len:148 (+),score=34.06 TRINITY_DN115788_c0_g1_i1:53-496(+)
MSSQLSSHVVWNIVRRESCFIKKNQGLSLSAEPLNITNLNSYKYSGLAQDRAVGVATVSTKKGDRLQLRSLTKHTNKPTKAVSVTGLTHGRERARKAIHKVTAGTSYRPDLKRAALAKYNLAAKAVAAKVNSRGVVPAKKARRGRRV